jgi:coenzyme F420 hydrogenase subunit beta
MSFLNLEKKVVRTGLCTSCGTCAGVCPISSIRLSENHLPELVGRCNSCGQCIKFCPVINFDFDMLRRKFFKKSIIDPLVGPYLSIFFGQTADSEIRAKASGGGIVSALLINALDRKLIDGAIVVKLDEKNVRRTKVFVAKNKNEILDAAGSKYISSSVNTILKEVAARKGAYAFVGLPCHVHALRKLQIDKLTPYSNKIKYIIGLFCGFTLCDSFLNFILSAFKVNKQDVETINFRYKRTPLTSSLLIKTKNGKRFYLDRVDYSFLFYLFTKESCLYCFDHTNEFADISIGDMRPFPLDSPNYRVIKPLQSVIVVRTKKGVELLQNAKKLELYDYNIQDLIASKLSNIVDKKFCSYTRLIIRQKIGMGVPRFYPKMSTEYFLTNYGIRISQSNALKFQRYVYELFWITLIHLMQKKTFSQAASKFPLKFWKVMIRKGYLHFKLKGMLDYQLNVKNLRSKYDIKD